MTKPLLTPYPELNHLLEIFIKQINDALGDTFVGAYLHGTFAVGDFDQDSDVNFVIVLERPFSDEQVATVQAIHAGLHTEPNHAVWAQQLDGAYFPKKTLWEYDPESTPLWVLKRGEEQLVQAHHSNNLTTRWIMLEHGIVMDGPPTNMVVAPLQPNALRRQTLQMMHNWAQQIFDGDYSIDDDWAQFTIVTTLCCMLHSMETGGIESRPTSSLWAKAALDSQWDMLIKRAWDGRPLPHEEIERKTAEEEREELLEFVEYATELGDNSIKRFKYLDLVDVQNRTME